LGVTPSAAINMFYRQIVHRRGIPFDVALPESGPGRSQARSRPRPGDGRGLRYGDFPHLFWDARAEEPLDLEDPFTLARFLTRADPGTVADVVTLDEIRERLPGLPLRPEARTFWEYVLRGEA
jgi:hypothetical protein